MWTGKTRLPVDWFIPVGLGVAGVESEFVTSPEQSFWKLTSSAVIQFWGVSEKNVLYSLPGLLTIRNCTTVEMWTTVSLHLSSAGTLFVIWRKLVLPGVPTFCSEKSDWFLKILMAIRWRQFGLLVKRSKWTVISGLSMSQSSIAFTLLPVQSKSSQPLDLASGGRQSKIIIQTCNIVMLLQLRAVYYGVNQVLIKDFDIRVSNWTLFANMWCNWIQMKYCALNSRSILCSLAMQSHQCQPIFRYHMAVTKAI